MPTKLKTSLHNTSEIGRLRKVILHRPGRELENLMPEYLEQLLFDGIPYWKIVQGEHDAFANCLRENGVEVIYLRDLVMEIIAEPGIRRELTEQFLDEAGLETHRIRDILNEYFSDMSDGDLVDSMIAGLRKSDIRGFETGKLTDEYPFLIDPIPNLYFTRDPFAVIGAGVSLYRMHTLTRRRETLFGKFIFKYHPVYKNAPKWYDRGETSSLEGGDILILSPQVLAVGISQRTQEDSIDKFAHTVLSISETFQKILAFNIPKTRSFMHLDTIFTMVDRDKFIVHPNILQEITVFIMELVDGQVHVQEEQGKLENILKRHLELDHVQLIPCGSDSSIDVGQWSDGSNTLAIAPGEVVVYERSYVTNRVLEDNGIIVHTVPCSELSRGRGGPRCMSMPLIRDNIEY